MLPQRSASSLGRPTRTELALLLAARPEPLRERMESADGNDTHEPGRDRDVRSASAANGLTFAVALLNVRLQCKQPKPAPLALDLEEQRPWSWRRWGRHQSAGIYGAAYPLSGGPPSGLERLA